MKSLVCFLPFSTHPNSLKVVLSLDSDQLLNLIYSISSNFPFYLTLERSTFASAILRRRFQKIVAVVAFYFLGGNRTEELTENGDMRYPTNSNPLWRP
jgi:hypothetical protein